MKPLTLVTVHVTITDRWAVGAVPDASAEVDLPVVRNPRSDLGDAPIVHIPGTSLAGSLRRYLGDDLGQAWLGSEPGAWEQRTGELRYRRSRLRILGCRVAAGTTISDRGATSVDAARGAAQGRTLRTQQWVSPGEAVVVAVHDGPGDPGLRDALVAWRPVLGRARTSGLGRAQVTHVRSLTVDLSQGEHLTWWLTGGRDRWFGGEDATPAKTRTVLREADPSAKAASPWGERVRWRVREPVHVGVGAAAPAGDFEGTGTRASISTVAEVMTVGGRCVVPGSSWKGVFRHRVRVILDQCGMSSADVDDVLGTLFGSKVRRGVLVFEDSCADAAPALRRTHAPIDRFTGGALDGGLHSLWALDEGAELEQCIRSDIAIPGAVTNLLRHAIQDISDGLVGVGRGSSRGYGQLEALGYARPGPVDVAGIQDWVHPGGEPDVAASTEETMADSSSRGANQG